eukprot:CAMPEP_0197887016 /NCGR_PEP_ID=MMETSP1439-20131203/18833_1 /TAXON_ID=66791 /ORGANISM="Gonyaulax spinifera, Strain CCMP409" /LENGTH=38 /DNA_ID= /DNA_START= /DNA_END= /DNA_ORIENTATION=
MADDEVALSVQTRMVLSEPKLTSEEDAKEEEGPDDVSS